MTGSPDGLHAFADESVYASGELQMYLMCASVLGDNTGKALDAFSDVRPRDASKLHWRDMDDRLQTDSLEALARVDHASAVIVASPLDNVRQERGRRLCLDKLIPFLEGRGVTLLTLEGRNIRQDRRDIEMLDHLRKRGASKRLSIEHLPGSSDVRLWIPDQILGAFGDILLAREKNNRWLAAWSEIEEHVSMLVVDL